MPFNKGDFTQQGINGHVNAIVRLNEKRLVNIDLTSNEEAEGCTIAGAVTDLLNNEVYPIGAGVSGNIEITENGENINVAPYATATVNVSGGSSDFTTAQVTIINNKNVVVDSHELASIYDDEMYLTGFSVEPNDQHTYTVILYKGSVELTSANANNTPLTGDDISSTSGSLENNSDEYEIYITISGDCSITFA